MAKHYGTGLIGLDVKPRRMCRVRRNRKRMSARWLVSIAVAVVVGLVILAGVR